MKEWTKPIILRFSVDKIMSGTLTGGIEYAYFCNFILNTTTLYTVSSAYTGTSTTDIVLNGTCS